jgi:hypothetical protein
MVIYLVALAVLLRMLIDAADSHVRADTDTDADVVVDNDAADWDRAIDVDREPLGV